MKVKTSHEDGEAKYIRPVDVRLAVKENKQINKR